MARAVAEPVPGWVSFGSDLGAIHLQISNIEAVLPDPQGKTTVRMRSGFVLTLNGVSCERVMEIIGERS